MIDVVIQAGHEGGRRNAGDGSAVTVGTRGEMDVTPVVADRAAATLRRAGLEVVREDAFYDRRYDCRLSVSLHFDGSSTPCRSGASIGYPPGSPPGSNRPAADAWRRIYGAVWPFRWMPDNFTANLSGYYGYRWTATTVAEILIEFGELTCPDQAAWLHPRIADGRLGDLVARWAMDVLDVPGDVISETVPPAVDPWAVDAWIKARDAGAITDASDPDSTITVERLVTILDRLGLIAP